MAWSIPTYAGTRSTGQPSGARTAMFELCRGINERQAALAMTETQWYKADGTQTANITMADLDGLRITGTNSLCYQNMMAIRSAINALIATGKFTETSGKSNVWTLSNIEAAIGTDLGTAPIKVNEARWWQAQQDALDLLLYVKTTANVVATSGTGDRSRDYFEDISFFPNTEEIAWGDVGYATVPVADNAEVSWSMGVGVGIPIYKSGRIQSVNVEFSDTYVDASLVRIDYLMHEFSGQVYPFSSTEPSASFDYSIGSAFGNTQSNAERDITRSTISNDFSSSLSVPFSITTPPPSSSPFNVTSNQIKKALAHVLSANLYWDLAPILTDQA